MKLMHDSPNNTLQLHRKRYVQSCLFACPLLLADFRENQHILRVTCHTFKLRLRSASIRGISDISVYIDQDCLNDTDLTSILTKLLLHVSNTAQVEVIW